MENVDGQWACAAATPMGEQRFTLTVKRDGDAFTGSNSGALGSLDIADGVVDGNTLIWAMAITSPLPMTLTCTARVSGDALEGTITAGGFGSFPMTGVRQE